MNFIVRNEDFQCLNCNADVGPLKGSCRNHCPVCLYSQHVDAEFPGDRASTCKGLMQPIALSQNGKKGFILLHKCVKCSLVVRNKMANDDNMSLAAEISKNPYET